MNLRNIFNHPIPKVFLWISLAATVGGTGVYFLERQVENQQIHSFPEALWWAVVTMTTVGYGDYTPQGPSGRLLAVLVMFTGISLVSFLTASIASVSVARRMRANQGLAQIKVKDHIIICGWHHKVESLLDAFFRTEEFAKDCQVVLVNTEHEDTMQSLKNEYGYSHIKYIRGEFTRENTLRQANIETARAAIILPTESPTGVVSDEKTIMATLTIKNINPEVQVIAYVHAQTSISHVKRANADHVVLADNFSSFIIASYIMRPGIPQTIDLLLDTESEHHFRRKTISREFLGNTFEELGRHNRKEHGWMTIGLYREEKQEGLGNILSADTSQLDAFIERKLREAGQTLDEGSRTTVLINPPDDYVIKEGDGAIVIP